MWILFRVCFCVLSFGVLLVSGATTTDGNCTRAKLPAAATASDCPLSCIFEGGDSTAKPYCRDKTVCDVPLNYSLPSPYGCPIDSCEVKSRLIDGTEEGDSEYCGTRTFVSVFETLYWGKNGSYPFGYLFWNILVALTIVLYLQFSPRFTAIVLSRLVNGLILNPKNEIFFLSGVSVMIIGGRAVFRGIEYLTPNVHVKCVDISINIKWWRGASDIRQSPSAPGVTATVTMKSRKLPFRMSIYFTGLEVSVFNNTGKYDLVEEYVLNTIYRNVFHCDPPKTVSPAAKPEPVKRSPSCCTRLFEFCLWRCLKITSRAQRAAGNGLDANLGGDKPDSSPDEPSRSSSVARETPADGYVDPLPRAYYLFPITRVQCRNLVVYIGAPSLPTTLVVHVRTALGLHYAEPIGEAPNKGLDSYRIVNKADLRGVVVSMHSNSGYMASEEMALMRKKIEKKSVDAREVLNEILRNVKTSLNDVKIGMKDVRTDLGQTLGVPQQASENQQKSPNLGATAWEGSAAADEVGRVDQLFQSVRNLTARSGRRVDTNDMDDIANDMDEAEEENETRSPSRPQAEFLSFASDRMNEDEPNNMKNSTENQRAPAQSKNEWSFFARWLYPRREKEEGATLLNSQLQRQRQRQKQPTTYQTVRDFVTRPKKKGPRPVPEPDIIRAGKIEVFFHYDQPGRVSPKQVDSPGMFPAPRQSIVVNIGGGAEDEETLIVYGPWVDRQRALFQEHFFPYVFEDAKMYSPIVGQFREATNLDARINFSRLTEVRLPYREQDLGLLVCGNRSNLSGGGDSGLNEDSEFWFQLKKKLQEMVDEQTKRDEMEAVRAENANKARHLRRVARETQVRRRNEAESPGMLALREVAKDGWLLCKGFSMDTFLDNCVVDTDDESDVHRLVESFNAVATYQAVLVNAITSLDAELTLLPVSSSTWSIDDKARWLWGEYAGREGHLVSLLGESKSEIVLNLTSARRNLPVPQQLRSLLFPGEKPGEVDLLTLSRRHPEEADRFELGRLASDPRCRLGEWFHSTQFIDGTAEELIDEDIGHLPEAQASMPTQFSNHANVPGGGHTSRQVSIGCESFKGPIASATSWRTTCGWIDVSVNAGSSVHIDLPWYPLTERGLSIAVNVDLKKPKLYCSVTRSVVAEAAAMHTLVSLAYPLAWNGEQTWGINITMQSPKFRMLKADMQALSDLGKDWSSNSIEATSVGFFVPAVYRVQFSFTNAELLLNVNESNVVDLPEETAEHNTFVSFSIPSVFIQVLSDARSFKPLNSRFDVSVEWTGNKIFQLPVRASLILPSTHPRRSIPLSVSGQLGQGQGGATIMPDPVFMEMQRLEMDISYTYHHRLQDGVTDFMDVDVRFDQGRMIAMADAVTALKRFQENYMGGHVCQISQEAFRTCDGENFKTLLAYRNWYEVNDSFRRITANDYESHVRLTFANTLFFFPTVMYPRVTADGVMSNPDEEAITVFSRDAVFEIRMRDEHFAEYSCEMAPLRIQVPGSSGKGRTDPLFFQDSLLSRATGTNSTNPPTASQQTDETFARAWLRGSANLPQGPGAEVGQLVMNGLRMELQTLYGRALRDHLAPSIGYRTFAKVSVGSVWGDLEIYQISQIRDALAVYDLMLTRLHSFDRANGGTRDPALCTDLGLGQTVFNTQEPLVRGGISLTELSADGNQDTSHPRRASSMSIFGGESDGMFDDEAKDILGTGIFDDHTGGVSANEEQREGTSAAEDSFSAQSLPEPDQNTSFFRVDVIKASFLPRYRTNDDKSDRDTSRDPNTYCQVVYGSQGFRTHIVPNTSNPEWNVGYTFLCSVGAHFSDVQDIRIAVIDGSYGWKRKIGEIVIPADSVKRVVETSNPDTSVVLDGTYFFDATNCHHSYSPRVQPPTAQHTQPQPALAPFSVMQIDYGSAKVAQIKLSFRFFSVAQTIEKIQSRKARDSGRRLDQVFASASSRWNRDPPVRRGSFNTFNTGVQHNLNNRALEEDENGPKPGDLSLDPRVVASREWRDRFIFSAAQHVLQNQAMVHVTAAYAHNTVIFSSGPVAICAWTHTGDSFIECSLSQCKFRADTLCNTRFSWKVSTEGRDDISISIKHFKRSNSRDKQSRSTWALLGSFAGSFDARAFRTRSNMQSEVAKQSLFLDSHDHANRLKRSVDALGGLHGRSSMTQADLHVSSALAEMLKLMPRVTKFTFQYHEREAAAPSSPLAKVSSPRSGSEGDSFYESASTSDEANDDASSFISAFDEIAQSSATAIDDENSSAHHKTGESADSSAVYVSTRFSSLPLDGPSDPYGLSTTNLEPFLPMYTVERFVETGDYWYGSAFGWAMTGSLTSAFVAHQSREMGIAPSARTEVTLARPALLQLRFPSPSSKKYTSADYWENARTRMDATEEFPDARTFVPVTPCETSSCNRIAEEPVEETFSVRVHISDEVEALLSPATIVFAEDALHRWFPAAPTVSQMADYFERNYLVLPRATSLQNRLAPHSLQSKFLLSCGKGISLTLMHGSKLPQSSPSVSASGSPGKQPPPSSEGIPSPTSTTAVSSAELVYATRVSSGPLTLAKRTVSLLDGVSSDKLILDVAESSLVIQVASAYDVDSHAHSGHFPVFKLLLKESMLVRTVEERELQNHQSCSTSASFKGIELIAGVDSVYVTYSVLLTWSDLLLGYLRESAAIWHRQRRQWAVLAGQLLLLSKTIDETEAGTAEKEPRLGMALLAWCRREAPDVSTTQRTKVTFSSGQTVPPSAALMMNGFPGQNPTSGVPAGMVGITGSAVVPSADGTIVGRRSDDRCEIPLSGWSTLVRTRRIACFLSEHHGTEDRMRNVDIDRYPDVHPVVSLETFSGARTLFPEFYFRDGRAMSTSVSEPHFQQNRSRSLSKESGISRTLVVELLRGVANRAVVRRKALGSNTISYEARLDGFIIRVLDSSSREHLPPRRNPLDVSAIAMRPANVLCMFIRVKPSQATLIRHGKRGSTSASELRDRRASDMQVRKRIVPTSITETVRGTSMGLDCTTSPELILASRAGATVVAHYNAFLALRRQERAAAAEIHKKDNAPPRPPPPMASNIKSVGRWGEFPATSMSASGSVASTSAASTIPFHTNSHRVEEQALRRTSLDGRVAPLSGTHASLHGMRKEFSFPPKMTSERGLLSDDDDDAEEQEHREGHQRSNSATLSRSRSFVSSPHAAWDTPEGTQSQRELGPRGNIEKQFLTSGSFTGFSSRDSAMDEKKNDIGGGSSRRRVTRSSFATLAGFGKGATGNLMTYSSAGREDLPNKTGSHDDLHSLQYNNPVSEENPAHRKDATGFLPQGRGTSIPRTISFDPVPVEEDNEAVKTDRPEGPTVGTGASTPLPPPPPSNFPPRRLVERSVTVSLDLHSAYFRFTSSSLQDDVKAVGQESQGPDGDQTALVTCSVEGVRLNISRALSSAPADSKQFRDFAVVNLARLAIRVQGGGKVMRKSVPWSVEGQLSHVIVNVVTGIESGTMAHEMPQDARIFVDGKRSRLIVPLHAIDNREFQNYVDSWVSAFRLASEHAEVMRLGSLDRKNSYDSVVNRKEPLEEAASSLLALGLPTLAQQFTAGAQTLLPSDLLMQRGVGRHGVWPDPFGQVGADTEGEGQIGADQEPSTPQVPFTSNAVGGTPPDGSKAGQAGVGKRTSATGRVGTQYQAVMRESVVALLRTILVCRLHDVEVQISPLSTVMFTSGMDHITLAADKRTVDNLSSLVYIGPSTLTLNKVSAAHTATETNRTHPKFQPQNSLEITQFLPSAWVLANVFTRQKSVLRSKSLHSTGSTKPATTGESGGSRTLRSFSSSAATVNIQESGAQGIQAADTPKSSTSSVVKVTFLVEAIRHSFTPSIIQQFLVLQSGLKTEISILLETAAKFSEQRRNLGLKPPAILRMESEYRLYLQGLSFRAKASSQPTSSNTWAEFETGGIELNVTGDNSASSTLSCAAKISDLRMAMLSSPLDSSSSQPVHLFKLLSNVDVTNIPRVDEEMVGTQQTLSLHIQRTALTIRPRVFNAFSRWHSRYSNAIERYFASRAGLEEVDLYAKKVWDNVIDHSDKDATRLGKITGKNIITNVVRLNITDSSLIIPFLENSINVSSFVSTLNQVEILGRSEAVFEKVHPGSATADGSRGYEDAASRLVNAELRNAKRRYSSGNIDPATQNKVFQRELISEKTRYVGRVEAREFASSFVDKGALGLLECAWIPSVVHKGAKCNLEVAEVALSLHAEDSASNSAGSTVASKAPPKSLLVQVSVRAPRAKCDRSVSRYVIGMWHTFSKPRKEDESMLRVPGEKSSWWDEAEATTRGRFGPSGSLEEFDTEGIHVVSQEQTLFGEDVFDPPTRVPVVATTPSSFTRSTRMVPEASAMPTTPFSFDFNLIIDPGVCDIWGEEIQRSSASTAQHHGDTKRQNVSRVRGPRQAMVAAQRAASEYESMLGPDEATAMSSRASLIGLHHHYPNRHGPKRSSMGGFVGGLKGLIDDHGERNHHQERAERLFVIDLPQFRLGVIGKGTVESGVESIWSHLQIKTTPLTVSPRVLAFFEETVLEMNSAMSEFAAKQHQQMHSDLSAKGSSIRKKNSQSTTSESRFSSTSRLSRLTMERDDRRPDRSTRVKAAFTMRMSPFELNLKSSQDQPMSSLKLKLDSGLEFSWSDGDVKWDSNQRLSASILTIPMVSLVVHELNPVISASVNGIRVAFNRLTGVFADDKKPLYTCLNTVDSINCFFSFWRIEAFFALLHDWNTAWVQLLEERRVRKEYVDRQRSSAKAGGAATGKAFPPTSGDPSSSVPQQQSNIRDQRHQRNLEVFENYLKHRTTTGKSTDKTHRMRQKNSADALGTDQQPKETWRPSIILFASTRVRAINLESQLGVLASKLSCSIGNVASRLALPGQLAGQERNPDPDTFYITANRIAADVSGLYEGCLVLNPGCVLYVAREKPPMSLRKQDWQPWYQHKTTLNKTFFRCEEVHLSLSRVLSGEKAKTKTHLFLITVSKTSLLLRDEITDDGVVAVDATVECDACLPQISVDAPPILTEASEQLYEQILMARRSKLVQPVPLDEEQRAFTKFRFLGNGDGTGVLDQATSRAFRAIGTVRVRFESFDLSLVHEPSSTAWGATVQFLGARLICKKSADRCMMRDLTLQTGGADIFRYHGHHWKGISSYPIASIGGASTAGIDAALASSNESQESEDEQTVVPTEAINALMQTEARPMSQEDAARRTAAARKAVTMKRGKKNIVSFPKCSLVMVTKQHLTVLKLEKSNSGDNESLAGGTARLNRLQPAVVYKFTSTFRDAISVSTDRREYAKLREIIGLLKLSSPDAAGEDVQPVSQDTRQFQQSDDTQSFVLEPQLNIMGEATTAVLDWFFDENIQLQKNELPRQVHIMFTDTLESVLSSLQVGSSAVDNAFNVLTELEKDRR